MSKAICQIQFFEIQKIDNFGQYNEAIQCYERAIQLNPNFTKAIYNKAISLKYYFYQILIISNIQQYEEAIKCYDRLIQLDPNNISAFINKGISLRVLLFLVHEIQALEQQNEAITCFDKVLQLDPNHSLAFMNKGISLENLFQYNEAIICYDRAIQLDPTNEMAFFSKGDSLKYYIFKVWDQENQSSTMRLFNTMTEQYNQILILQKHINQKVSLLRFLIRHFLISLFILILKVMLLERFNEAIKCYDQAIELDPNYTDALNNKGLSLNRIFFSIQKYLIQNNMMRLQNAMIKQFNQILFIQEHFQTKAIKYYDRAIQYDPNIGIALINKGECLQYYIFSFWKQEICNDTMRPQSAMTRSCNYILMIQMYFLTKAKPYNIILKLLEVDCLNQYEEAIKCYDSAIELDPSQATLFINKGILNHNQAIVQYTYILILTIFSLNKFDEGLKCFERAIQLDPNDPKLFGNKGDALSIFSFLIQKIKILGDNDNALKCYNRAIELDPNYSSAYQKKGMLLQESLFQIQ